MVVLSNNAVNEFVKPLSLSLLCALEEKQQTVEFTECVLVETGTPLPAGIQCAYCWFTACDVASPILVILMLYQRL